MLGVTSVLACDVQAANPACLLSVRTEAHYRHRPGDRERLWQISGTAGSLEWLPVFFPGLTVLPWASCRPQPPTQNMNLGPGALAQGSSSQGLHSQGGLSDAVGSGLPPPSLLQGQIGNGERGVHSGGARASVCFLGQSLARLPGGQQPRRGAPCPSDPQWPGQVCGCMGGVACREASPPVGSGPP